MKIGILGAGRIGATTAQLFGQAGHEVAISHSGDPDEIKVKGPNITTKTADEAVNFGDVILIAVPWTKRHNLPQAQLFEGKITIDAMNPYGPNGVEDLGESTSSEEVEKQLPTARLVKAFNTMYYETLRTRGTKNPKDQLVLFIAGDDSEAKEVVAKLIEDIGFAAIDTGFLHEGGRRQQPGSPIYNAPMTVEEAKKRLENLP